jgi:hypothetical protein
MNLIGKNNRSFDIFLCTVMPGVRQNAPQKPFECILTQKVKAGCLLFDKRREYIV